MNNFLYWLATASCLVFVTFYQARIFGRSFKTRTRDDISSFFLLNEVIDKHKIKVMAALASVPLSFVFFIIAYYMPTYGTALVHYIFEKLFEKAALDAGPGESVVSAIPIELYPLIVLLAAFLLFGAQVSFLFGKIEKAAVFLFAVRIRTNEFVTNAATELLGKESYEEIIEMLNGDRTHKVPLAEELEEEKDSVKLAFQILHIAKQEVKSVGLNNAIYTNLHERLREILLAANLLEEPSPTGRPTDDIPVFHVFAAGLMFFIACTLYLVMCPLGNGIMTDLGIAWPNPEGYRNLVSNIVQVTITTIIPCIVGVVLYQARVNTTKETRLLRVLITSACVITTSLVLNFLFIVKDRLGVVLGVTDGTDVFMQHPELIFIVSHSLIPFFAVLFLLVIPNGGKKAFAPYQLLGAVAAVSLGHCVSQWVYEHSAKLDWAFYWHQGLLAAVLSITVALLYLAFRGSRKPLRTINIGYTAPV